MSPGRTSSSSWLTGRSSPAKSSTSPRTVNIHLHLPAAPILRRGASVQGLLNGETRRALARFSRPNEKWTKATSQPDRENCDLPRRDRRGRARSPGRCRHRTAPCSIPSTDRRDPAQPQDPCDGCLTLWWRMTAAGLEPGGRRGRSARPGLLPRPSAFACRSCGRLIVLKGVSLSGRRQETLEPASDR